MFIFGLLRPSLDAKFMKILVSLKFYKTVVSLDVRFQMKRYETLQNLVTVEF